MKLSIILAPFLLSLTAASKDNFLEQQTPENTSEGHAVSNGKVIQSPRYLEPMARPTARSNLRVTSAPIETQEKVQVDQSDRNLQASATVTLVNNCGYDAFIGMYYQSNDWTYGRGFYPIDGNDGAYTIQHQVSNPIIHVYGLDSNTFESVWSSPSSEYCYSPGECFREVNLGSLASGNVQYNLCGSNPLPSPTPPPTPPPTPVILATPPTGTGNTVHDEWVLEHNLRRTDFFVTRNGMTDVPLKWSGGLAYSSAIYANKLAGLDNCQIQHGYQGDSYGGENLAANWGGSSPRSPSQVLTSWYDNEIDLPGFYEKLHATQVAFRSSLYFGCGEASKVMSDGRNCYIQVCRYLAAGNCFTDGKNNWVADVLSDTTAQRCGGPQCPPEGCF